MRIISVGDHSRSCTIQWIEAAPGAKAFDIPKGALVQQEEEQSTVNRQSAPYFEHEDYMKHSQDLRRIQEAINAHAADRKRLVELLMSTLEKAEESGNTKLEKVISDSEKAVAIRALGEIRAAEAAPLLASIIDLPISAEGTGVVYAWSVDTQFGCVPALTKIGKPGATACLEAIVNLTTDDSKSPLKERLLCSVIARVEGAKFTRLLLEDRKQTATHKEQIENLDRAIALMAETKKR